MELKEIKAVIDLMTRNGLAEFELEKPEFKIRVKKGNQPGEYVTSQPAVVTYAPPVAVSSAPAPSAAPLPVAEPTGGSTINSPMVGTFYRSPSPDSPAYVEVGKEVGPETVVCIIEAMKVMNEIKAEAKGVITEVLAETGKPVEFGKPLFRIRPL